MPDDWWRGYVRRLTGILAGYERRLLGGYESLALQRVETAECLDRERASGRIR